MAGNIVAIIFAFRDVKDQIIAQRITQEYGADDAEDAPLIANRILKSNPLHDEEQHAVVSVSVKVVEPTYETIFTIPLVSVLKLSIN